MLRKLLPSLLLPLLLSAGLAGPITGGGDGGLVNVPGGGGEMSSAYEMIVPAPFGGETTWLGLYGDRADEFALTGNGFFTVLRTFVVIESSNHLVEMGGGDIWDIETGSKWATYEVVVKPNSLVTTMSICSCHPQRPAVTIITEHNSGLKAYDLAEARHGKKVDRHLQRHPSQ